MTCNSKELCLVLEVAFDFLLAINAHLMRVSVDRN